MDFPGPHGQHTAENDKRTENQLSDSKSRHSTAFQQEVWQFLKPEVEGIGARYLYLALTDQIVADNRAVQKALIRANTPVAQQLLERWELMEDQHWRISGSQSSLPPGQVMNGAQGLHQIDNRLVIYQQPTRTWQRVLGGPDPVQEATSILAHELGHHDGHNWHMVNSADAEANVAMAKRLLSTEARALVSQIHLAQATGADISRVISVPEVVQALRQNDLGGYIYRNWKAPFYPPDLPQRFANHPNPQWRYTNYPYPEFQFINEPEARLHVNQYLTQTFGHDFFDTHTGKVKPININAGLGNMNYPLHAGESTRPPFEPRYRWQVEPGSARPIEAPFGSGRGLDGTVHRGLHCLAALGMMACVSDVGTKFGESAGAGFGEIGRVGVSWGAFEVSSRLIGATLGRKLPLPLTLGAGLALGALTSHYADRLVGKSLAHNIRSAINRIS
jgi:hypothetical protein